MKKNTANMFEITWTLKENLQIIIGSLEKKNKKLNTWIHSQNL